MKLNGQKTLLKVIVRSDKIVILTIKYFEACLPSDANITYVTFCWSDISCYHHSKNGHTQYLNPTALVCRIRISRPLSGTGFLLRSKVSMYLKFRFFRSSIAELSYLISFDLKEKICELQKGNYFYVCRHFISYGLLSYFPLRIRN